MKAALLCLAGWLVLSAATFGRAADPAWQPSTRRFALISGSNHGGPGRVRLHFAASDARAFTRLIEQLGGVEPNDRLLLLDPDRAGFLEGLQRLRSQIEKAKAGRQRVELLIYYSGHSDDEGLLLHGERVAYPELREFIRRLPADVCIAILDSCASGALTRRKGGQRRAPFLFDTSARVKGHAFLTSSSANETAQESDRIGASFFTHYLISGLRGAADTNGDGKVTLDEAYQFAFQETLARTERTLGGAQHPAYEMQLAGSGNLVITDLRGTSAGLALSKEVNGRIYLRNSARKLVVELHKLPGQSVELGLEPGEYQLILEREDRVYQARLSLKEGAFAKLSEVQLSEVKVEPTLARGTRPKADQKDLAAVTVVKKVPKSYRVKAVNLSLLPPISFNGSEGNRVINYFSLGMLASRCARLHGLGLGGFLNFVDEQMQGFQLAGVANVVGADARGFQFALGANVVKGHLAGLQTAIGFNQAGGKVVVGQLALGANLAGSDMVGLQSALGFNYAGGNVVVGQMAAGANVIVGSLAGVQGALGGNFAGRQVSGLQVSLGLNLAGGDVRGGQLSTGLNLAGNVRGAQVAAVNVAADVFGVQIGLVNTARKVKGVQLGLVNVSQDVDGFPLGLFNYVKNGQFHLDLWADEMSPFNLGLKMGSRHLYTIFTGGFRPEEYCTRWYAGLGLGGSITMKPFFIKFDIIGANVRYDLRRAGGSNILGRLRLMVGWQPFEHLAIFAGASFNAFVAPEGEIPGLIFGTRRVITSDDVTVTLWPGFFAGFQI